MSQFHEHYHIFKDQKYTIDQYDLPQVSLSPAVSKAFYPFKFLAGKQGDLIIVIKEIIFTLDQIKEPPSQDPQQSCHALWLFEEKRKYKHMSYTEYMPSFAFWGGYISKTNAIPSSVEEINRLQNVLNTANYLNLDDYQQTFKDYFNLGYNQ